MKRQYTHERVEIAINSTSILEIRLLSQEFQNDSYARRIAAEKLGCAH